MLLLCCHVNEKTDARCPNEADYDIYDGPEFSNDTNTHSCASHLADMLTDAHEHRIFRLT